jgi:hypothetical protein
MTEIIWFIYGVIFGYFMDPLIKLIKAIIREAKIAKQEWRKDGRD